MPYTLDDLDAMTIDEAQGLPFADRDALLDLIIADGRKRSTTDISHRVGLYHDYFDEDLTRMLKVKASTGLSWATRMRSTTGRPFATWRPP